jgi:hypothetical protein
MTVTPTDADSTASLPSDRLQRGHQFHHSQVDRAIDAIEGVYTFDKSQVVRGFLRNHPGLLEVLVDALPQIDNYFQYNDLIVSLTRSREPGERDERGLYVRIVTSAEVEQANQQLDAFDDGWWLAQPFDIRSRLCFDIDFR